MRSDAIEIHEPRGFPRCGAPHKAEFERELIQERIRSGIAAAKARGKRLGRQPGQRPKSDRLAPRVLALVAQGCSYRLVGREVGLSKNTVADIIRRNRSTGDHKRGRWPLSQVKSVARNRRRY